MCAPGNDGSEGGGHFTTSVPIEEMSAQNHIPTKRPTPKIPSTAQFSELDRPIISLLSEWILTSFAFPTRADLEDNPEAKTVHLKGEGRISPCKLELAGASVSYPVYRQVKRALGYLQCRTILTSCGLFPNPEDNAVPSGHQVLMIHRHHLSTDSWLMQ